MATVFTVNKPVTTTANFVDVTNNLPAGVHTFQLVVVDDQGNQSDAVKATVTVRAGSIPLPPTPIVVTGPVVRPSPLIPTSPIDPTRNPQ